MFKRAQWHRCFSYGALAATLPVAIIFLSFYSVFFFTQNPKMMEWMEQDAQLQKVFFFYSTSLICICDALIQVVYNVSLHLFL